MRRHPHWNRDLLPALVPLLPILFALALAAGPATPAEAAPYAQGERIRVTGVVTDGRGTPLADVRVILVASRSYFNLRQLKSSEKDERRVAATTDAKGAYTIEWAWDNYYNNFEVQVGLPVRAGRAEKTEVLARQDLSQQLAKGNPVVPALVVQNAALIDKVRRFLSELATDDERWVYEEMGNPDEVKKVRYPDHEEAAWWYFESGAVYRFEGGKLKDVVHFTPVKPF
jgi:uncharacterized protein with FMN-binding domain